MITLQNVNNAPNQPNGNQTEQKRRGSFTNKTILAIYLQQPRTSGEVFKNYPFKFLTKNFDTNFTSLF